MMYCPKCKKYTESDDYGRRAVRSQTRFVWYVMKRCKRCGYEAEVLSNPPKEDDNAKNKSG
jgi:RNase P subunit RPR2